MDSLRLPELPENVFKFVTYGIAVVVVLVTGTITRLLRDPSLDAIPTFGSSSWIGSIWAGLAFMINAPDVIREGYKKHKSAPFKVADRYQWTVILSDCKHLDELQKASDDVLSSLEALHDRISIRYTMAQEINDIPYHIEIIRSQLTQNMGALYPDIRDEIVTAFDEILDLSDDDWKKISALSAIQKIVCRASNRIFVGLPLCRDLDWIDLNIQFTIDTVATGLAISFLPKFLRPLAAWFTTVGARGTERALKHLSSIIEERLKYLNEYGKEWTEKPKDLLSWLMEQADGLQLTARSLSIRMLAINVAANHTSSNSFTYALFYLAANPRYVQPLREEVESVVEQDGWSKAALSKMHKVDSFLRECLRLEGMNTLGLIRKALKDFTFSDGTFIPKGTLLAAPALPLQHDDKFYDNAKEFRPFRFAEMHGEGEKGAKYQYVSTGFEYLPFGHGRHACPGRFFAAIELKTMLAHTVMTYDVKLEDNASLPRSLHFGTLISVNPFAKVMFRKRLDKS